MYIKTNKIRLGDLPYNLKEHFLLNFLSKLRPNHKNLNSELEYTKKMLNFVQHKFNNIEIDLNKEAIKDSIIIGFIHKQTNIDFIGQQLENNCFNQIRDSHYIPIFCAHYFNTNKYNQDMYSDIIILYSSKLFDSEKFNQDRYCYLIPMYCP